MKDGVFKKVVRSFGPVILVAALGSLFVFLGMDWFDSLIKPSQWLSNVIIPIVWTVIYSITGIVIFKWVDVEPLPKSVLTLFVINGALNILWCLLFFTLQLTFVGAVAIIINLVFGWLLLSEIAKYMRNYFYALLIYPIWLGIATALNVALWILN